MVDGVTQTEDVRFKNDAYERMTVPVRLSGQGPFRFMVDTGADRTAVSSQLAARLNLTSGANATLHSVTGASDVQTALVPELQLSRRSVRVVDAPLLNSEHMGADGILGVDFLRSQRVQFDFENNLMSIVPSSYRRFDQGPGCHRHHGNAPQRPPHLHRSKGQWPAGDRGARHRGANKRRQ